MSLRVRIVSVSILGGTRATSQQRLEADVLTIGRGTDNCLRLGGATVPLRHSELRRRDGGLELHLVGTAQVEIDGRSTTGGPVAVGNAIRIGDFDVRLIAPAADEDVALEVEPVAMPAAPTLASRSRMGVERGPLGRWWLSTAAVLVVLAAFLVLPLAPHPLGVTAESVGRQVRVAAWTTGPMSRAHEPIAADCAKCHSAAFAAVPDDACLECHASTGLHAAPDVAAATLRGHACTSCHEEHDDGLRLVRAPDADCVACHGALAQTHPNTSLRDVSDFASAHPEFRPAVVTELDRRATQRMVLGADGLRERSGLAFSHFEHLKKNRKTPVGVVTLECASCHVMDDRGALMRPVTYREHCQRCHRLTFAGDIDPAREAPHATPDAVRADIEEFFGARALEGAPRTPFHGRRQPGRPLGEVERAEASAWAAARTKTALTELFAKKGQCAVCHELDRRAELPRVLPVSLLPIDAHRGWLSLAAFRHQPHVTLAPCERCHAVAKSDTSETIALPDIAECRKCHASSASSDQKLSDCTTCHRFHLCRKTEPATVAVAYDEILPLSYSPHPRRRRRSMARRKPATS